jgi:VWFA-related protein
MGRVLLVLALVLLPTSLASQNPPEVPPIRVSTYLVQIGVIVHDKQGPVDGLTKDDFTVYDRGKVQSVRFFSVASSGAAAWPAEQLPPSTFSNLAKYNPAAPGSITIVLLDNLNTLYGSAPTIFEDTPHWAEDHALTNAKAHLLAYLRNLGPQDRVALYGLSDNLHVLCDFTTDRSRLISIVEHYDASSRTSREIVEPGMTRLPQQGSGAVRPPIDEGNMEMASGANASRDATTLGALKAIADHVANIPGRKNLVWLTANLPFSAETMAAILGPAQVAAYPVDSRGLLPRSTAIGLGGIDSAQPGLSKQISGAFNDPNRQDEPMGIETAQRLAELTGGRAFVNGNDLTGAIRDAVVDASILYTLGFYIDAHSADGKFHELKVAVNRSGVTMHYPRAYWARKDTPATKEERHNSFLTAIQSPLDASAIPLQIQVARVNRPAPNSLSLSGSIGIHDLPFVQSGEMHTGTLDITVIEQNETGKVLRESANRINLRFTEKQYPAILKSGITFQKSVQPQAGVTTLRVLVQDPSNAAIGSLIIPLSQVK